ncbi:hypothetical protein Avbf_11243 [Armadillidium vulgare]|nr:hypothetical protein Avbf_11243 [Armadillidium vulgare]
MILLCISSIIINDWSVWINFLLFPYISALIYTCGCQSFVLSGRKYLKEYLNDIKTFEIHSHKKFRTISIVAFTTSMCTCILFYIGEKNWEIYRLAIITYTLLVPNVYDFYILLLLLPLSDALTNYEKKIMDLETLSKDAVYKLANEWLLIKKCLIIFERIFGKAFTCRIILFIVQLMCLIYMLTSMKWSIDCMMPISPILLTTYDLSSKLFLVAVFGSRFVNKNEYIIHWLSVKRFKDENNQENASVGPLIMIAESQPCVIRMWGIGT